MLESPFQCKMNLSIIKNCVPRRVFVMVAKNMLMIQIVLILNVRNVLICPNRKVSYRAAHIMLLTGAG